MKVKVQQDPADHEARAALAALYAGKKRYREALDALLEIVRRAKDWKGGEARTQILNLFTLAGEPELVSEYRRKLSSALY
jgi:putative thioredoxin